MSDTPTVQHSTIKLRDGELFYREAGPRHARAVLLLHGFPSSSFMYRNLMPALADRWRVIAPDYPGFGYSSFPDRGSYRYSFEGIASVIEEFTQALALERYSLYIQDYGVPIGLRIALRHPEKVSALIVQNGNAYEEGMNSEWSPLKELWKDPSAANRDKLRAMFSPAGARMQYEAGVRPEQIPLLSPDTWTLDWALISRSGRIDVQLDLMADYPANIALYPEFQKYLRQHQPPALIVWGRNDPFFTKAVPEAYRRDLPEAELHLLDTGHFALETHAVEVAGLMRDFLTRKLNG